MLSFPLNIGQIFMVLCILSTFGLYPGHFEYDVARLWVLLKFSVDWFCCFVGN